MTLLLEYWKPVVGYEGLYEVSNTGRIRGLVAGVVLQQRYGTRTGYHTVSMSKQSISSHCYVQVIVAEAFIEQRLDQSEVVHKDRWRTNNRPSNLEYRTAEEMSDERAARYREYQRIYHCRNKAKIKAQKEKNKGRRKVTRHLYYLKTKHKRPPGSCEWRKRNRDRLNERDRQRRKEGHPMVFVERARRLRNYTTRPDFRLKHLVGAAKSRGRARGTPMDEGCFDFILAEPPARCACCGRELDYINRRKKLNPSIDRICNDLNYVSGNVAVICFRCNNLKRDGSIADFEMILAYMRRGAVPT